MEPLHDDEADTGSEVVLDLLRSQAPHLAALSLVRISGTAGNTGSDNVLYLSLIHISEPTRPY